MYDKWSTARCCNENCRDGYWGDRAHGLIYGFMWEEACRQWRECVYCRADIGEHSVRLDTIYRRVAAAGRSRHAAA